MILLGGSTAVMPQRHVHVLDAEGAPDGLVRIIERLHVTSQ